MNDEIFILNILCRVKAENFGLASFSCVLCRTNDFNKRVPFLSIKNENLLKNPFLTILYFNKNTLQVKFSLEINFSNFYHYLFFSFYII